jgi:hypothetical protein
MFDEPTICLLPFTEKNLFYVKGWDGFIDPDGNFYKVIERGRHESPHEAFVESLMRHKKIDIIAMFEEVKRNNPKVNNYHLKDMLINVMGYVNYEHCGKYRGVELGCPNPIINNKKVTEKQIDMIVNLVKLNNDDYNILNQIFCYDNKHNPSELQSTKMR